MRKCRGRRFQKTLVKFTTEGAWQEYLAKPAAHLRRRRGEQSRNFGLDSAFCFFNSGEDELVHTAVS